MSNSLLGYLFCLFATTLHFKLFQQETMVEMMTDLGNTSQCLLDNQKKILAGGPTPTTTRNIKIPATCRSYGGAVVNTPPVGSAPVTTPVIVTYSGAQPTTGPPLLTGATQPTSGPPLLTGANGSTTTVVAAEKETQNKRYVFNHCYFVAHSLAFFSNI